MLAALLQQSGLVAAAPFPLPGPVVAVASLWLAPGKPEEVGRGSGLTLPAPQILERLNKMCGVGEQMRKKQQRLLKNMDAHKVMLDLLQIPYDKVSLTSDL